MATSEMSSSLQCAGPWLLFIKHIYQTYLSAAPIPVCAEQWQARGNANTLAGPGTPGHVLLTEHSSCPAEPASS